MKCSEVERTFQVIQDYETSQNTQETASKFQLDPIYVTEILKHKEEIEKLHGQIRPFRENSDIHCQFCGEQYATEKHAESKTSAKRQRLVLHRKKCLVFMACVDNSNRTYPICRICCEHIKTGRNDSIDSHFAKNHPEKLFVNCQKSDELVDQSTDNPIDEPTEDFEAFEIQPLLIQQPGGISILVMPPAAPTAHVASTILPIVSYCKFCGDQYASRLSGHRRKCLSFMECVDNDTRTFTCRLCNERIKKGNATNSIEAHFEKNHPEKLFGNCQKSVESNLDLPIIQPKSTLPKTGKMYKWDGKLHPGKKCLECEKTVHPATWAKHVRKCSERKKNSNTGHLEQNHPKPY